MPSSPRRRVRPDFESSRWRCCAAMRLHAWAGRRFGKAKPFPPKTWKPTTFAAPTRKFSREDGLNSGRGGLTAGSLGVAPTGLCLPSTLPRAYESVTKRGARSWKNAMFGNSGHRFLLFPSDLDWSAQLASQGMLQLDCAENIQHAFQVVDHTSQTDLR